MITVEDLRKKTIESLAGYYKMFKKGWISEDEWRYRRDMAYEIFAPDSDSQERKDMMAELKAAAVQYGSEK